MNEAVRTIPEYWLPRGGENPPMPDRRRRVLIGKAGLDGHDRGAKYVAQLLRDAGFDVVYTGIRRTPEQIVDAAIAEGVAAVGLSFLSGAHRDSFRRVLELLERRGASNVVVFGGGVIPAEDVQELLAMGVRAVFTPGTSGNVIVAAVAELLGVAADAR